MRGTLLRRASFWAFVVCAALWMGRVVSLGAPQPPLPPPPPTSATGQGAVPVASPKASGPPPAPTDYNVKMTASFLKYDDIHKILTLDGNVTFTHVDTIITSPHAVFNTERQVGHFSGGVRMSQPGTTLTGAQLDAYYAERKAVLTGDVQMITEKAPIGSSGGGAKGDRTSPAKSEPKPAGKGKTANHKAANAKASQRKSAAATPASSAAASPSAAAAPAAPSAAAAGTPVAPTTPTPANRPAAKPAKPAPHPPHGKYGPAPALPTVMLTDQMIYYWDKKEGDAIGDVKIRQGDKRAFSDRAHYTGAVNQVRLFENVRFERGENDSMISEEAIVDLAKQTFTAQGGVEATVLMEQTPSPSPAIVTPQGDRVLKPAPPTIEEHPAPDGLPDHVVPGFTPSPAAP